MQRPAPIGYSGRSVARNAQDARSLPSISHLHADAAFA
jgi:hypothetical protein